MIRMIRAFYIRGPVLCSPKISRYQVAGG